MRQVERWLFIKLTALSSKRFYFLHLVYKFTYERQILLCNLIVWNYPGSQSFYVIIFFSRIQVLTSRKREFRCYYWNLKIEISFKIIERFTNTNYRVTTLHEFFLQKNLQKSIKKRMFCGSQIQWYVLLSNLRFIVNRFESKIMIRGYTVDFKIWPILVNLSWLNQKLYMLDTVVEHMWI